MKLLAILLILSLIGCAPTRSRKQLQARRPGSGVGHERANSARLRWGAREGLEPVLRGRHNAQASRLPKAGKRLESLRFSMYRISAPATLASWLNTFLPDSATYLDATRFFFSGTPVMTLLIGLRLCLRYPTVSAFWLASAPPPFMLLYFGSQLYFAQILRPNATYGLLPEVPLLHCTRDNLKRFVYQRQLAGRTRVHVAQSGRCACAL